MSPTSTPARSVSVIDGRRTIGSVLEREDGFEAISVAGHSVGLFHNEPAAATELWRHDRGMPSTNEAALAREVAAEREFEDA